MEGLTNMSDGLKEFERIQCNYVRVLNARENGKTQSIHDLNTIKKHLKAFKIIKKKKVFIAWLKHDLSTYNNTCALYGLPRLKEEEFNLLKEVGL